MYEVVWPRGRKTIGVTRLARRENNLKGKTICELWDGLFKGDRIFPLIEKELSKRHPGTEFVSYQSFGCTHGEDERKVLASLADDLKRNKCDAVISGIGC